MKNHMGKSPRGLRSNESIPSLRQAVNELNRAVFALMKVDLRVLRAQRRVREAVHFLLQPHSKVER